MQRTISNADLRAEDVPHSLEGWQEFALTFNGYEHHGSFEACAKIANAKAPRSLTDFRSCLFFEQRRWRHFGADPDAKAQEYLRSLLNGIRTELQRRDG